MRNKYVFRSHISEAQFRMILTYFCEDIDTVRIHRLTRISRVTLTKLFRAIRLRLFRLCEYEVRKHISVFECDESYFGARRVKGLRGRGARGKIKVFGIYDRQQRWIYTRVIQSVDYKTIMKIIEHVAAPGSTIYSDGFRSYVPLSRNPAFTHETVNHYENEFARRNVSVNGVENFWGVAKVSLMKRRGLRKSSFYLHLKECEFKFNHRGENIYKLLLKIFRNDPLKFT